MFVPVTCAHGMQAKAAAEIEKKAAVDKKAAEKKAAGEVKYWKLIADHRHQIEDIPDPGGFSVGLSQIPVSSGLLPFLSSFGSAHNSLVWRF